LGLVARRRSTFAPLFFCVLLVCPLGNPPCPLFPPLSPTPPAAAARFRPVPVFVSRFSPICTGFPSFSRPFLPVSALLPRRFALVFSGGLALQPVFFYQFTRPLSCLTHWANLSTLIWPRYGFGFPPVQPFSFRFRCDRLTAIFFWFLAAQIFGNDQMA